MMIQKNCFTIKAIHMLIVIILIGTSFAPMIKGFEEKEKNSRTATNIFFDDFNDNSKNLTKWNVLYTSGTGTWSETNQRTEFQQYEGSYNIGIESSEFTVTLSPDEPLIIDCKMITNIGSTNDLGRIFFSVTDGTNWIRAEYWRLNDLTRYRDSNDAGAGDGINLQTGKGDGTWNNEIMLYSDRYKVTMDSTDSGIIYDSLFGSHPTLKVQFWLYVGGSTPSKYTKTGFDNIYVNGSGLEGYWNFDEGTGTYANDSSGQYNNGTINGATWMDGITNNALLFDGIDDVVTAEPIFLQNHTINAWVNVNHVDNNSVGVVIENHYDPSRWADYALYVKNKSGRLYPEYFLRDSGDGENNIFIEAPLITKNIWHMITCSYNGSTAKLYLDGELIASESLSITIHATGTTFSIGDDLSNGNLPFNGSIDEVRVFPDSLTDEEISQLYYREQDLIAYWKFDEGAGAIVSDSSGWNNSGSVTDATWTDGIYGKALSFDGNGDYVDIPNINNFKFNNQSFTFSAWVQLVDNVDFYRTFVSLGDSNEQYGMPHFNIAKSRSGNNDGKIYAGLSSEVENSETLSSQDGSNLPKNTWMMITGVVDYPSEIRLYINDEFQSSNDCFDFDMDSSTTLKLHIGRNPWTGFNNYNYHNGLIDEVRIYKRALTDDEIETLYSEVLENELRSHWKFDEGFGSIVYDSSGMNNSGTIYNAIWTSDSVSGNALEFDGDADMVTMGDDSDFDITGNISISLWFKTSLSQVGTLVNKIDQGPDDNGYWLGMDDGQWIADGTISFKVANQVEGDSYDVFTTNSTFNDGIWHHLVGMYTPDGVSRPRIFIDGEEQEGVYYYSPLTYIGVASLKPFRIGRHSEYTYRDFQGIIDDVRVYNRSLDEEQINAIFDNELVVNTLDATGIEETNATLNGYLTADKGENCKVGFDWGLTASYGNKTHSTRKEDMEIGELLTYGADEARQNVTLDANSTLEGMYCVNISKDSSEAGTGYSYVEFYLDEADYLWDNGIIPRAFEWRFQINETSANHNWVYMQTSGDFGPPINTYGYYFRFRINMNTNEMQVYDNGLWDSFSMPFEANTNYYVKLSDVYLAPHNSASYYNCSCVMTIYNETSNEINSDVTFRIGSASYDDRVYPFSRFHVSNEGSGSFTFLMFVDDWTTSNNVSSNEEFDINLSSLSSGELYHFRAFSNNTIGKSNGSDKTFLTKPLSASSFTAITDGSLEMDLSWTKGEGANYTYIERNATGQTNWNKGEGIFIYNGTGTITTDSGLKPETTYYYQTWSYSEWSNHHKWSDEYTSTNETTESLSLQDGLVGYWSFNNSGNPGIDYSGNDNNGTNNGATWTSAGKNDGALLFDGINDDLQIPNDATLNTYNSFSIAAWFKPFGFNTIVHTIATRRGPGYQYSISIYDHYNTSDYCFYGMTEREGVGSVTLYSEPDYVEGNNWYFGVYTYDGNNYRLYFADESNNLIEVDKELSSPISPLSMNEPLYFGSNKGSGGFFHGLLDEIRVYNRPLSMNEIQTMYTIDLADIFVDDDAEGDWYDATHVRTIQEGIDNASDGDTIFIYNGVYDENVNINKSVTIIGEDPDLTIIDGAGRGNVVEINDDFVNISGLTIQNAGGSAEGIVIIESSNISIFNNIIKGHNYGIFSQDSTSKNITINENIIENNINGIQIENSGHTISGNFINNLEYGIVLSVASESTIAGNTVINHEGDPQGNEGYGIWLFRSENINIIENIISNNEFGIRLTPYSSNNNITGNIISSNVIDGIYLQAESNVINSNIIEKNKCAINISSPNHMIYNNNISLNDIGVNIYGPNVNLFNNNITSNTGSGVIISDGLFDQGSINISQNVISENFNGIDINSLNWRNNISSNNITSNTYGILIDGSSTNISVNNIMSNTFGVFLDGSGNNISQNVISSNQYGLNISSDNNNISVNNITGNVNGILIEGFANNISSNNISSNSRGIIVPGESNNISSNNISNNPVGVDLSGYYNNISSNNISDNTQGITLSGYQNNISNNNISNNNIGSAFTTTSYSNNISNNNISVNEQYGVEVYGSNNLISKNHIESNQIFGIQIHESSVNISQNTFINDGIHFSESYQPVSRGQNNISSNTVNGNPLEFFEDTTTQTISGNAGQIVLVNCNNITVQYQNISNTCVGIQLWNSSFCNITSNNISYTYNAVELSNTSSFNTIATNNISTNVNSGTLLTNLSNNNTLISNQYLGDSIQISDSYNNTVINNTVNGLLLLYLENEADKNVDYLTGQIVVLNCANINISNQDLTNTDISIQIIDTSYCNISNSNISGSNIGIHVDSSDNINISGNNITNNDHGIYVTGTTSNRNSNNIIEHNIFNNNNISGIYLEEITSYLIRYNNLNNNIYGLYIEHNGNNAIIRNNISSNKYGIYLDSSNNNNINLNNISSCQAGVAVSGLFNNISLNNISNNAVGVNISGVANNISVNNISVCSLFGVVLNISSQGNVVFANNISDCVVDGVVVAGVANNISVNNISGVTSRGVSVCGVNISGMYNNISENNISGCSAGVGVSGVANNISMNNISSNAAGVNISGVDNYISVNNISSCQDGVVVSGLFNNISLNNISNNAVGVNISGVANNISMNNISSSAVGVMVSGVANNISVNNISVCSLFGVVLNISSQGNVVFANNISDCVVDGVVVAGVSNNISVNNISGVTSRGVSVCGVNISGSFNDVYLNNISSCETGVMVSGVSNNISVCNISGNVVGVNISGVSNNISSNNISLNSYGVNISGMSNNISTNNISSCQDGVVVSGLFNNISLNNISNNAVGVNISGVANNISMNNISSSAVGVMISGVANNISVNNISVCSLFGVVLNISSQGNVVFANNISDCVVGGVVVSGVANNISVNNISGVTSRGVSVCGVNISGSFNDVYLNNISSCETGVVVSGMSNNISVCNISGNVVGVNISGVSNNISSNNISLNTIGLNISGIYNTIIYNNISQNTIGVNLPGDFNNITYNIIMYNAIGINISGQNNTVYGNNISNNNAVYYLFSEGKSLGYGILTSILSSNNRLYSNRMLNNDLDCFDQGNNVWYDEEQMGGNYWFDYEDTDRDGDGIGDSPHPIPGGSSVDPYPLGYFYPLAGFSQTPENPVAGYPAVFNDLSYDPDQDGYIVEWFWDFGDGHTSIEQHPTHEYGNNGSYQICLNIIDNLGDTNTTCKIITVLNAIPLVNFTWSPENPTTADNIQFTDTSEDPGKYIIEWFWDFGDGNTSTEQHPIHSYGDDGIYTVCLTITDEDYATNSTCKIIDVENMPPTADFNALSIANYTIEFTDISTDSDGHLNDWQWDFGDGNTSTEQHPTHIYADNETYNVCLTVTDDDSASDTFCKNVDVSNPIPTCQFTVESMEPYLTYQAIYFNSTSTDRTIVNWTWDMTDGTILYGPQVVHQFTDNGDYPVSLTVTDDDGDNNSCDQIVPINNREPVAEFTYLPNQPVTNTSTSFMDESEDMDGTFTNWLWDFGDGNSSTEQHPTHTYTYPTTYNICLTVTDDDGGENTSCKEVTIKGIDVNQSVFDRGFPIRHAADGDWAAAQSFIPTLNTIANCEIYMRKFGNPEFNLTVNLRTDHPQGPILDTLIFTPEEVPTSWTWFNLDFNDTSATPDIDYFIVCPPAPSGVTTSFGYEWGYAFGNQYDDGAFWFTRDGGALWRDLPTSYEFRFKTYGYN